MTRPSTDASDRTDDRQPDADGAPATDVRALDARLAALERAVGGADADGPDEPSPDDTDLATAAETAARLDALEDRLDALEATTDELDAATQALRGYVGSIRSVNERVRTRADRALAVATDAPVEPDRDACAIDPASARADADEPEGRRTDVDAGGTSSTTDGHSDDLP